jgi:hypothetical protein
MKISEILPNIYFINFPSKYEAGMTLVRFQEFYESSYSEIRGKFFTLDFYKKLYSKKHGCFSYCSDWSGYNLPDFIIKKFIKLFNGKFSLREKRFIKLIKPYINSDKQFYIIGGAKKDDVLLHEIAHALFYLNKDYAREIKTLIKKLPAELFMRFETALINQGYGENVLIDELQAYAIEIGKTGENPISDLKIYIKDLIYLRSFYNIFKRFVKQEL